MACPFLLFPVDRSAPGQRPLSNRERRTNRSPSKDVYWSPINEKKPPRFGEILVYRAEDRKTRVEVRFRRQNRLAGAGPDGQALFQTTKQNVSLHTRNVFKEKELRMKSVVKDSLTTAAHGKKYVTRFFNLDVIISVGSRVKSTQGTRFRQWATKVLRAHL
jgi:hypothetical protein